VDDRARRVAEVTGLDPREVAVIYEESDVLGAIPVAEIGEDLLLEHAADRDAAREAIDEMPSSLVTERNGRLCSNVGVDWSNTPEGIMTLLPEDPAASARRIRERIEERTGADVAVVLADSEILGPGTMDLAVGCSGIEAIDSNFGQTDLYDQPKIGGLDLVANELTTGSALLFGQADERTPVVVVRTRLRGRRGGPELGGIDTARAPQDRRTDCAAESPGVVLSRPREPSGGTSKRHPVRSNWKATRRSRRRRGPSGRPTGARSAR
jgi:coenzyme F420-0:L-glutamate ligase/coenzyme F420-1:gamma-L-glutamate ligase